MAPSPKAAAASRTEAPNPGVTFRAKIEAAKQDGIDPSALLLRLTRGDISRLRRDPNLATTDISFAQGKMHFLGVMVSEGEVAVSDLIILQPSEGKPS